MSKSYSVDLRERALNHLEKNHDKKAASVLFQVGIATIFWLIYYKKLKGNVGLLHRKIEWKIE